jgi:Ni,Fe-hydrogenase maturation factor
MADRARKLILIASGNPLRRDDGVAHRVLRLLGDDFAGETRSVLQLRPELAGEIAGYDSVLFLDADADAAAPRFEPLRGPSRNRPMSHALGAAEIVALATALFGFTGLAVLCRIPASDFSHGEGLSARSEAAATQAASLLSRSSAYVAAHAFAEFGSRPTVPATPLSVATGRAYPSRGCAAGRVRHRGRLLSSQRVPL